MQPRALITSASNKFFPSLLNLLGSIKQNYPNHPPLYIYNLGLANLFVSELRTIAGVTVLDMPHFVPYWRSCYTWKPYIFAHPLARANFYLDAGCQVLKPLDDIFGEIEENGFFIISQGGKLTDIVPADYKTIFGLGGECDELECIHAGIFGFAAGGAGQQAVELTYAAARVGLALGFSKNERWRNRGVNETAFVRDCALFRHDMTLLNIAFRKYYGKNLKIHSLEQYAGWKDAHPQQYIWHVRLNFKKLDYVSTSAIYPTTVSVAARLNRLIVAAMLLFKNTNLSLKRMLNIVK